MYSKFAAVLTIAILTISAFAMANPASAHFTLGDLTGTYRYRTNDFDQHVRGVIGYVWPGGGQNTFSGFPNILGPDKVPGYQSPYPGGKPPAIAGQWQTGGAPSSSWYQLEANSYSPFGAVLAGSTGDLIFGLNATNDFPSRWGWDTLAIYIPPGFKVPDPSQIISTISNDYSGYYVVKAGPYDRYAPSWTVVYIVADANCNNNNATLACGLSQVNVPDNVGTPTPSGNTGTSYYNHQWINFTNAGEWYYVRINAVTATSIAGRYFFKIALLNSFDNYRIAGEEGTAHNTTLPGGEQASQFIPTENWPVMLVKGENDPAIITGTIRYAGYNQTLYNQPIQEAGKVYAKMTMRVDPYTGQQRPDLPVVDAVGYFNATAQGHYEVEGLAPGVYDLYASAAGYPQTVIASGVTVLKGQSLHYDGYLNPGVVIHGNVYSKHQFGEQPWPETSYVKIELYDGPTMSHIPVSSAHLVSWSPLPCVAGGQEYYYNRRDAGYCGDPRLGGNIAFPWHEYVPSNGYYAGTSPTIPSLIRFYQVATGAFDGSQSAKMTQDPQGVGPPQHWFVQGGTTTSFHFEFGVKGEYGAPRDLDGMVPQLYATWVNGLTPGRYYARAWTFRYVQSASNSTAFQEYYFDITPNEWAGDVTLPMELRLSSWVNKTVHFHNVNNGLMEDPIDTGAGELAGVLVDANGQVWSYNQTLLGYKGQYTDGFESGMGANAFNDPTTLRHENDLDKARLNQFAVETGRASIQFWGWNDTWGGENYGIPSGTYQAHVFALGYIETAPIDSVSITLSGNPTSISGHMYRGAGFNIIVYSIDWERPTVERKWVWGNPAGFTATGITQNGNSTYDPYEVSGNKRTALQGHYGNPDLREGQVGQEIDVAFYNNGTLVDFMGDEPSILADTVTTSCLFQNYTASYAIACGGGWNPQVLLRNGTYVNYQGNSYLAFFGQELKRLGYVGGYTSGTVNTVTESRLVAPAHFNPSTFMISGGQAGGNAMYVSAAAGCVDLYPSVMPVGQQYDLHAYTYGYLQNQRYSVYASSGGVSDIRIDLGIGVNVTLDILFKKEQIITGTPGNMSARVRLFDDSGNLVAEWMSSEGTYVTRSGFARAADGTNQYPFGSLQPAVPRPLQLNGYNYVPGGTTLLHVLMAGLPQVPASGQQDGPEATLTHRSPAASVIPKGPRYFGDPVVARTQAGCAFELDCYANPGRNWNAPGYYPNSGIPGAPDYQGAWTAEVDFVNWYANNTKASIYYIGTGTVGGYYTQIGAQYYPPVAGLLMGESYHTIPSTAAKSGISLTEDLANMAAGVGHSIAPNHLGPYAQRDISRILGAHNSGEASAVFEVDLNGLVSGNVLAFTWNKQVRTASWATVKVADATGSSRGSLYTYDGIYQVYLPPGTYKFTISSPGLTSQTMPVVVSSGQVGTGQNVYLEQSNIPTPEFNGLMIVTLSALAASLYILRRRPHSTT